MSYKTYRNESKEKRDELRKEYNILIGTYSEWEDQQVSYLLEN